MRGLLRRGRAAPCFRLCQLISNVLVKPDVDQGKQPPNRDETRCKRAACATPTNNTYFFSSRSVCDGDGCTWKGFCKSCVEEVKQVHCAAAWRTTSSYRYVYQPQVCCWQGTTWTCRVTKRCADINLPGHVHSAVNALPRHTPTVWCRAGVSG